ncbi:MAG TPA: GDP-mannose 4,6-dehydratase [Planctomycetota bacterium]|nr:GDP-mannose 4,6-dehydratase [Planctomycetota bacterium]
MSSAIVTGAAGQDGYFLVRKLLAEGATVHALALSIQGLEAELRSGVSSGKLHLHENNLLDSEGLIELFSNVKPDEFYNLAGQSSVAQSFAEPRLTWRTNTEVVSRLLECLRTKSPQTRFYQSSSTDMFGFRAGGEVVHNEDSALNPQSPYASAKGAAHLLCRTYREAYGLRVACGILSNHESHRRPPNFLTSKIVAHVKKLRDERTAEPLAMGNLKVERDWGFAPDYVEGMVLILRQISARAKHSRKAAEEDHGRNYRDYVLASGQTHAVWQLADRAFALAGFELEWNLDGDDPTKWRAKFKKSGKLAVAVDPLLLRPADPLVIRADSSRARNQLGWSPRAGLDVFLADMLR